MLFDIPMWTEALERTIKAVVPQLYSYARNNPVLLFVFVVDSFSFEISAANTIETQ
jgi:hypothetical protein